LLIENQIFPEQDWIQGTYLTWGFRKSSDAVTFFLDL
jgi:hypothetical protein